MSDSGLTMVEGDDSQVKLKENRESEPLSNGLIEVAKTNGHNGVHNDEHAEVNGEERSAGADLNDVIQNQLQPLLEGVSLNSANMNEFQQQLAAQLKQQQQHSTVGLLSGSSGATTVLVANSSSNGSSSSTSPPLKSSESSLSPTAQSQQISSASSSSILSTGSHSNANWPPAQPQQQQSSLASISPSNEAVNSGTGGGQSMLENMSSAAAAWSSAAINGANQQQISPNQASVNGGVSVSNMAGHQQSKQLNPAALASLLKANNLSGQQNAGILGTLNSMYATQAQLLKAGSNPSPAVAALAAFADGKMNGAGQQQRSMLAGTNGDQNGQLDVFNSHLVEMIKNDPAQLEQFLKLRNMYQGAEETNGSNGVAANGNTFLEELQQQLDQTVPANLAAAVAAAAAANLNFNQANTNRNSPRSMLNMPKYHHSNGGQHNNSNNNFHGHHGHHQNHHGHHHNGGGGGGGGLMSNGANGGHMMMSQHGYMSSKQNAGYQQHHYMPQQQQHGGYHPGQFAAMNQTPQNYHQSYMNMGFQQQQQQQQQPFGQFQDYHEERFSRKVFVGGLPPDIDEDEIVTHFRRYGNLIVDWPHKAESKSYFPPKGYAFLIFQEERNVQDLIETCVMDDGKLYMVVSSPSMKDKPVQIRPWCLADSDFVMDGSQPLDPRKTIFVGGVPRPLKAIELAMIMDRLYGGVCYAGIDTDPELKYPKGAGRVAFSNQQSYIAAISARYVQLHHGEIDKRVEVKPYVLDDQMCDECQGGRCGGKFAPFFCANVTCLQYYCEQCWTTIHSRPGREYHKPLVKEGADRPRPLPYGKSKNRNEVYD